MEELRHGQLSSDVLLGPCVRCLTVVLLLLTTMSGTTGSFIKPGEEENFAPNVAQSTVGEEGLEPADVAAIVLGILLVIFIIGIIVALCLIKKGKICVKEEEKKVAPTGLLRGFSTTSDRVRDCSFVAMTREKSFRRATPRRQIPTHHTDSDSIIYMYDDIYHAPNSRPLPTNEVPTKPYSAGPYVEVERPETGHRFHVCRHHSRDHHRSRREKRSRHTPRQYSHRDSHGAPTPPPTPEPEIHVSTIPTDARINITTAGRSPYTDKKKYRYY